MKWISNKTLFNIHGWLGLNLGLFLFVVCFSGTFATLSSEADWLLNAEMRVQERDAPIRWQAMYENIETAYPDGRNLGIYKNTYAGHGGYFATVAYVSLPNGQNRKVYLNPYSGEIQGDTSFFNVQRFFRSYHRRFFDGNRGIILVTLSSFFLLFSALTGFLFYKGWLKNLFKLRLKKGVRSLFSDVHKLTGIWSLIFTLLIAITGIFYFAELMLQAANNYDVLVPDEPAALERVERSKFGPNPELLSLDQYVANAKEAFPELEVYSLRVPHTTADYVYVDGQAGNPITRNRANKVYLHPFTGEVVQVQRASEMGTAHFITDIADPLHFGYFGGLATKIIWFLFGLALSFSILTGTYLWYIRGLKKMERRLDCNKKKGNVEIPDNKDRGILETAGFFSNYLTTARGAVISSIIIIVYLVTTGVATVKDGLRSYGPLPDSRFELVQNLQLGPLEADLKCEYPCSLSDKSLFLDFRGSGLPNYAEASLQVDTHDNESYKVLFSGYAKRTFLAETPAIKIDQLQELQVSIAMANGAHFTEAVDISSIEEAQSQLISRFDAYPDKEYPEVSAGVYAFIIFFGLLTIVVVVGWTYFLIKTTVVKARLKEF